MRIATTTRSKQFKDTGNLFLFLDAENRKAERTKRNQVIDKGDLRHVRVCRFRQGFDISSDCTGLVSHPDMGDFTVKLGNVPLASGTFPSFTVKSPISGHLPELFGQALANCLNPDQSPLYAISDQDLNCLVSFHHI